MSLLKNCGKKAGWKNFVYFIHSFSGNFEFYKGIVENNIGEKDIEIFIEICDNRIERAKTLLSDVATVLGFLITGTTIIIALTTETLLTIILGAIIILGFALLFHYRANIHAWTAFKEGAILNKRLNKNH